MKITKLDFASWGGFMVYSTSTVLTPICLPEISRALSTSLSEGGAMESARTVMVMVILILSGILAQKWGKKPFLSIGEYLLVVGLLLASMANDYVTFLVSLMTMGIGGGTMEALLSPVVVDLHPDDSGTYMNVTHAFYPIGLVVSALLFGELLTLGVSWRYLFRLVAVSTLIIAVLFTILRFPQTVVTRRSTRHHVGKVIAMPGFWLFAAAIFLGGGVESAFTFWSTSYVATYLKDVPRAGAIAVMIFAAMMASGRLLSARLSNLISLRALMTGSAILGVAASAVISSTGTLAGFYALVGLAGLATACFWPTILAEAAAILRADTTILFMMLSCVGIAGFGFTPWLMGMIGDRSDLKIAFAAVPGLFIIMLVVLLSEWHLANRYTRDARGRSR